LYNGNIGAMEVDIAKFNRNLLYGYRYDQLNRITKMDAFTGTVDSPGVYTATAINDYRERVTYDPNGNILTYKRNGTNTNLPPGVTGGFAMDSLAYEYIPNTNKLKRVTDNAAYSNNYPGDIDNQTATENYLYDAIGNLIKDKAEGIDSIYWNVYGKISRINKSNGMAIVYVYDAAGNRISKSVTRADSTKLTYYVRDAGGNVMSIYQRGYAAINSGHLSQAEINLYGSSRLGVYNVSTNVQKCFDNTDTITNFTRGNKFFELTNHLGSVLVIMSDKTVPVASSPTYAITGYTPEVATATDYYPFGMQMPGRAYYIDTTTENVGGSGGSVGPEPPVVTIYKHTFNTSPYNHPYTISPDILDASLNNTGWTNSKGAWTSYSDCATPTAGQSLAFTDTRPDTSTLTLTLSVDSGKTTSIRSFSFTHRSSATGYAHWKMYINGIEVGDSTLNPTAASGCTHTPTGTRNVTHPVENLTGTFTVVLKLYDHTGSGTAQGTFRMNDFILNGVTRDVIDSSAGSQQWANKRSYRYGFNGKENDNDVKGEGNQQDYGMRIYDPRLGRFLSVDPITKNYPMLTPYQYASNNPIQNIDIDGLEGGSANGAPVNTEVPAGAWNLEMLLQALGIKAYLLWSLFLKI
jgi:RHS repeat-associated protein